MSDAYHFPANRRDVNKDKFLAPQNNVATGSVIEKIEQWMYNEAVSWWMVGRILLLNISLYPLGKQGFDFCS